MELVLASCSEIKCTCPYFCISDGRWGELQGSQTRWYILMVTFYLLLKPQECPATSAVTVNSSPDVGIHIIDQHMLS
jgi:hypothetical protein